MASPTTLQIVTDSTCALPPSLDSAARALIHLVRPSVQFGNESWLEGTFTLDQFYAQVHASPHPPRTSQPAPDEFLHVFKEAAASGPVLAILLSGALSGTYATGVAMAAQLPEHDIVCFDSHFMSSALGYMVGEAAEMALAGASRAEILARLRWRRAHTALLIAIDSLDFLQRSGRVNRLQATIASMLDLKPVLAVQGGKLEVVARVRTRQRSLNQVVALTQQQATAWEGPFWLCAMHGAAPEVAARLLAQLQGRLPIDRHFTSEVPASIAVHGGPGVVGVTLTPAAPAYDGAG